MKNKDLRKLIDEYNSSNDIVDNQTRLYHDLHIWGDDASELLSKYSELYNVSLSKFRFDDYFPSEGDLILPSIFRWVMQRPIKEYKTLKVEDLEITIGLGYLE